MIDTTPTESIDDYIMKYGSYYPAIDKIGLELNGEPGELIAFHSRMSFLFAEQDVVVKIDFHQLQNETEFDLIRNVISSDHRKFFPTVHDLISSDTPNFEYRGYKSNMAVIDFSDLCSFLIESFEPDSGPHTCESAIMANRLANHYQITDLREDQFGTTDSDTPMFWDAGLQSSFSYDMYRRCLACWGVHEESLEAL
jgi:hypothetical protein